MFKEKLILLTVVLFVLQCMLIVWITPIIMIMVRGAINISFLYYELLSSFILSINTSFVASAIIMVLSIPTSYYVSRFAKGFSKRLIIAVTLTPLMISPSAIGSALLLFFTKNPLGLFINRYINVINDPKGVITAQVFIGFPLAVSYFIAVFSSIPSTYEEIAMVFGLDRITYLYRVLLPMTRKQVFLGFVLIFTRVFADFGASLILGGGIRGKTWTFPIFIYMTTQYGEITILATSISIYFVIAFIMYFLLFSVER